MSHTETDLQEQWKKINYAFPILNGTVYSDCTSEEFEDVRKIIVGLGLQHTIRDLVLIRMAKFVRQHIAPEFWSKFTTTDDEIRGFQLFKSAVNDLYNAVDSFSNMVNRVDILNMNCTDNKPIFGEKTAILGFKQIVRSVILSQIPIHFQIIINHFYKVSFPVFDTTIWADASLEEVTCIGCNNENSDCNCEYIVKVFYIINGKLLQLELLERLTGQVLNQLIQTKIETYIQKLCTGSFDVSYIHDMDNWLDHIIMDWLARIYGDHYSTDKTEKYLGAIDKFKQKLTCYMIHYYTNVRIDQLFNIIIEYPDSQLAVEDIKYGLSKTNLRSTLSTNLQVALEIRLLHPGVNTPDIITAYVSTIRALRHLDPSGVILEAVTKPVRNYLRHREDTVRSVVSSLTEEGTGGELAEELCKFTIGAAMPEKEQDIPWDSWNPDPIDADPKIKARDRNASDIISMLINVYGSKELFVNEYRTLLADRLLAQSVIHTEREIRYLELLKLRFGESQLHFCEVMLKDISDSKRINNFIQQDKKFVDVSKQFTCNAMILSAQFWPPFKDESLELPEVVKENLEAYTRSFEGLKGNRSLSWKPHLGNVNIEIEIGEKKLDLTVSPFNATVILHFQNKPEWSLDELHQVMKVPVTVLRRKITYWQSMGLITEKSTDYYVLAEGKEANKSNVATNQVQDMMCEDDETESALASTHDQREGELQVFWSYIVGMLTNLDSLPLDRIHQMLKMFASQAPGSECSVQELRQFLDTKVRSHQLVLQAGMYKLPKP